MFWSEVIKIRSHGHNHLELEGYQAKFSNPRLWTGWTNLVTSPTQTKVLRKESRCVSQLAKYPHMGKLYLQYSL